MSNIDIIKFDVNKNRSTGTSDNPVTDAVQYLRKHFRVKYNPFLNQYLIEKKRGKAQPYTKKDLRLHLRTKGFSVSNSYIDEILASRNSDFQVTDEFNPIHDFLESVRGTYKGESHIDKYCSYIKPKRNADQWPKYYKKWFCSYVATLMGKSKNDVMLTIVQSKGGSGKTEWLKHMTNIEAISFYSRLLTKNNHKLDLPKESTRNATIIFDELAALPARYIESFKSEISLTSVKTKHSHAPDEIMLPRLASFCATTNRAPDRGGFIPVNDSGLMRRLLTVENTCVIDFKHYLEHVNLEQMYAEALTLIENTDYDYVFNEADFDVFREENRLHLKGLNLEEVITERYQPGLNGSSRFVTATDILNELVSHNFPPTQLNVETIGKYLKNLGFPKHEDRRNNIPVKGYLIETEK